MSKAIAATVAVAAGLFAASMLGVAVAEAPTGTPLRTLSVQGVATSPIGQFDNAAAATAVYREGMGGAVTDGQSKAGFLAGKVGATVGPVQSVVEGGGYISCTESDESGYAEYHGEQPDFGSPPPSAAVPLAAAVQSRGAPQVKRTTKPKRSKRRRPKAKQAATVSCTLTAQVSLVYTIN